MVFEAQSGRPARALRNDPKRRSDRVRKIEKGLECCAIGGTVRKIFLSPELLWLRCRVRTRVRYRTAQRSRLSTFRDTRLLQA